MPVHSINNLFFSGLGVDFGHSFSVNAGLPPQGEKWSRVADCIHYQLYTLASRRQRAVHQRGQHHHHQHRPEVRAGTERGRCHVTQYSAHSQYWRALTRWSAGSRWSRRRRSWAAAACSGAARWAWQWAGHEGRYSHACLLNLFLQTEKKLYFGSGNQCYAGRSAGDACQVDSWSY